MTNPFQPAELGDGGIRHEVYVFVFRWQGTQPEYLLVKPKPQHEGIWRPVIEPIFLNEDFSQAALRGVREETGLKDTPDLVSPRGAGIEDIGDIRLVGWPFGYFHGKRKSGPNPRPSIADCAWASFEQALIALESRVYRQNLLRIHDSLSAA